MALKEYRWRGNTWQFDEAEAPAEAVPVEAKAARELLDKARQPLDKARKPSDKARKPSPSRARARKPSSGKA